MKIRNLTDKYNAPLAIALGFFDCIHKGHRLLVQSACEYANCHEGVESALLTFSNDPSILLSREHQIYDFKERAEALRNLGLQNLISTEFNGKFSSLSPIEFLDLLTLSLNIKAIIVGRDYTFGNRAMGDVDMLTSYCKVKNIDVIIKPFEEFDGKKISTSSLKLFVKNGNIEALNALLSEPYFMIGEIIHARHIGTKLGFPTANVRISENKLNLANGVYATILETDGKRYASMTNVGAKPTFGIENPSIETYILDFNDDLYGKTVKLSYISRMRDIVKFSSEDKLKAQLSYDEAQVRKLIKL